MCLCLKLIHLKITKYRHFNDGVLSFYFTPDSSPPGSWRSVLNYVADFILQKGKQNSKHVAPMARKWQNQNFNLGLLTPIHVPKSKFEEASKWQKENKKPQTIGLWSKDYYFLNLRVCKLTNNAEVSPQRMWQSQRLSDQMDIFVSATSDSVRWPTQIRLKLRADHSQGLPVMRASGRDCSFLQAGTKTVTSLWPLSKNQSTANLIPRQENTSLFPWLKDDFRTRKTQQNLNSN